MPHTHVTPLRVRHWSDRDQSTHIFGVGYRGSCSCGWEGDRRRDYRTSLRDAREHAEAHRLIPPPAPVPPVAS